MVGAKLPVLQEMIPARGSTVTLYSSAKAAQPLEDRSSIGQLLLTEHCKMEQRTWRAIFATQ
jgi:hypothetical protein